MPPFGGMFFCGFIYFGEEERAAVRQKPILSLFIRPLPPACLLWHAGFCTPVFLLYDIIITIAGRFYY